MWAEMEVGKLKTKKRTRNKGLLRDSSVLQSRFTKESYCTSKLSFKGTGRHVGVQRDMEQNCLSYVQLTEYIQVI